MSDIDLDLAETKKKFVQLDTKRIEALTRLSAMEDEKQRIVSDSMELGVNPKEIDQAIIDLDTEIQASILKIREALESFSAI